MASNSYRKPGRTMQREYLRHSITLTLNCFRFKQAGEGFDPIIGANQGQSRFAAGLDPSNVTRSVPLPFDFIVSQGGEYFFSPSLSSILDTLAV